MYKKQNNTPKYVYYTISVKPKSLKRVSPSGNISRVRNTKGPKIDPSNQNSVGKQFKKSAKISQFLGLLRTIIVLKGFGIRSSGMRNPPPQLNRVSVLG